MNHPNEEQLTLYCCGDADERAAVEEHLAECAECRAEVEALKLTLAAADVAPVPERGEDYGLRVWQRVAPRLDERRGWDWRAWFVPRNLTLAGAMAAIVLAAFFLGRISMEPPTPGEPGVTQVQSNEQVTERILLVAVGDHLERSQMVLVELVNTQPNGKVSIASEQRRADELVNENRLYRQTATAAGDAATASVLEELERTLLEIARSPSEMSSADLANLQRRIQSKGILFKVRVVGSQMREKAAAPPPKQGQL
jgi:anti-sigma factor RsiW